MKVNQFDREQLPRIIDDMVRVGAGREQLPDGLTKKQYRIAIQELAGTGNNAIGNFGKGGLMGVADALNVPQRRRMTNEELRQAIMKTATGGDSRDEKAVGQAFRKNELKYIATRLVENYHRKNRKTPTNDSVLAKLLP